MKKMTLIILAVCTTLAFSGCDLPFSSNTSSQSTGGSITSAGSSGSLSAADLISETSPYGAPIGSDPSKPYPVIKLIDENLWVEIDYINRNTGQTAKSKVKYYGIGRGFVSNVKLAEGRDCALNHLKQLSYSSCGAYPYKRLDLVGKSQAYSDEFAPEAYLMEKNFRGARLILSDKNGPYDIIFLENKTQTVKLARGGKMFDIFILESKKDDLDRPEPRRGTITMRNINGQTVTSGLSIRELLENCGQSGQSQPVLGYIGAIMLGPGTDDQSRASEEERINELNAQYSQMLNLPSEIYLSALKAKRNDIVNLNPGKESKTDEFLNSDYLNRTWVLVGQIPSGQEHPGEVNMSESELDLDKLIEALAGGTDKSTLVYDISQTSNNIYLTAEIGDTRFRYKPGDPGAQIGAATGTETQALGIGAVQIHQQPFSVSTDPWCGFTPECKPAIYLYPNYPMKVNVKIGPSVGQRTITIPDYDPTAGWNVWAMPWGALYSGGGKYSYLYYEAMTEFPSLPKDGWVLDGKSMSQELYKLGHDNSLSDNEAKDFAKYWAAKLPKSSYYFAGLVAPEEIEKIEPLEINPAPKSILRIRFYFVPLDKKAQVGQPVPVRFDRKGFTVVEWGGYFSK